MNGPNAHQLDVLDQAVRQLSSIDYSPYLDLRDYLQRDGPVSRLVFRQTFENYYGLHAGGVTNAFRDRYFQILFDLDLQGQDDPYTPILAELYQIPRHKGDHALQSSFVSKLVAIHDETRPILDRHVSDSFGIVTPMAGGIGFRIAGVVANLKWLRQIYHSWSQNAEFRDILADLVSRHPSLAVCATPRLADFLVWTVGRKKITSRVR